MNYKHKRPRETRQQPLKCKYWHRGMAKTNYRKQGIKSKFLKETE